MNVTTKRYGNILVAMIRGEIDHHISGNLSRVLDMEIVSSNVSVLIIDMSEVSFMDSSGIAVIMGRKKNMSLLGGKVCITGMRDSVRKLLEVTGFKGIIDFYDDIDSAMQDLSVKAV